MNQKKISVLFIISLLLVIGIITGVSYSLWKYTSVQTTADTATSKCFNITFTENNTNIALEKAYPITDTDGLKETGYSFTIKNVCETYATYQINLEDLANETKRLNATYVKVSLNNGTPQVLTSKTSVTPTISGSDASYKLTSGSLAPNDSQTYVLKLWMDEDTPASDDVNNAQFNSKVTVVTTYADESTLADTMTGTATTTSTEYSKTSETFNINATSTTYNIIEYSTDNGTTWNPITPTKSYSATKTYDTEGTYTYKVKDEVGNIQDIAIDTTKLDQTAPSITLNSNDSWTNNFTISATITDNKSGLVGYAFTTTETEPVTWTTTSGSSQTVTQAETTNGTYYLYVKDAVGNINHTSITLAKIDATLPTVSITNSNDSWVQSFTISGSIGDAGSGLAGYAFTTSETTPTTWTTTSGSTQTVTQAETANGTYYLYVKDALGNINHTSITLAKIDTESPTASWAINTQTTGSNGWYQALNLKATLTDSQSGVASAKYCVTTSTTCTPTTAATLSSNTFTFTLGTNASAQKVCTQATDNSGRVSTVTCSSAYSVDTSNPSAGTLSASVNYTTITLTANSSSDAGSGLATYQYSKDGSTYYSSASNTYSFTGLTGGTSYTFYLKVIDKSGRVSGVVTKSATAVIPPATIYVTNLKTGGDTSLEYDGTSDNNLRYIGANPNNYVSFNGELWRIIGVMNNIDNGSGTKETRLKIIRNESIGKYSWDSSDSTVDAGYGVNEWSQADLMTELNSGPYWNRTSGACYSGNNNTTTTCDFSSTGLTTASQSMIGTALWNTGANDGTTYIYNNISTTASYTLERSSNNGKICTSGTLCNDTVSRTTTWIGKVGLMYPSDYGYATGGGSTTNRASCLAKELYNWDSSSYSDCKTNDWLFNSSY